jgi:hypothetical protein
MTMQKKQHKFLAAFYPTGEVPTPDLIEKITAYGPDGYSVDIKNQPFDHQNRNGWLYNPAVNAYWYMINVDKGFLKAGEYTVEVKLKNGGILKKSRVQDNVSADALLASYLKNMHPIFRRKKEKCRPMRIWPMCRSCGRRSKRWAVRTPITSSEYVKENPARSSTPER